MSQFPDSRFSGRERPPLTRSAMILILVLGAAWLARVGIAPLGDLAKSQLWLSPTTVPSLKLWAPLTYALSPHHFLGYARRALMLYFFSADVERRLGVARWWWMIGLSAILGGVLAALAMWPLSGVEWGARLTPLSGFSAPVAALVAAYCRPFWDQTLMLFGFELKGKVLLLGYILLGVVLAILALHPGMLVLHLVGVGVGLGVSGGTIVPRDLFKRFQYWRIRRKLKVIARTPEADKEGRRRPDGTWIN